jgi:hypothetical protein
MNYKPEGREFDSRCGHCGFHWFNPSGRTMALGSIQPPTEMSAKDIFWGGGGAKAAGVWGWQPYQFHVPTVFKPRSVSLLKPSGLVQAGNGIALSYTRIRLTAVRQTESSI